MQTRSETRELEQITRLWTAANDAKAEEIRELSQTLRLWSAANQAKAFRIEELEQENGALRSELSKLRSQEADQTLVHAA
ncbi:MAG: hypothetical protein JRH20_09465 [Deltaproteobacteria bacterium]|nr:hypothetical protein [Deltaproteobacteria bacterium]